ncbi:glycosyltransferase family 4 protein [bacterium]|nr:glycosyltransferase family 4 protein [bacterium]
MRIAVACDEYCARVGNRYFLRDFGHTLTRRYLMAFDKIRLIVRTFDKDDIDDCGKFNIEVLDNRIEIYPIPFFRGPFQYLKQYTKVRKNLKGALKNCDAAIFRLPSTTGFAVWCEDRKQNLPYAVELVYDCKDGYINCRGLKKYLWWRMHRKQVKACKHAIGMAPVTSGYLQSHYSPDRTLIQSHYSSVEMTDDFFFQPRNFPDKKSLTLVHVANQVQFRGRKGHEDVISAVKILREKGIPISVTFVGENYDNGIEKLKEYAKALKIEDSINFTGFLSSSSVRDVLLKSDIAILPTRAEGLPRVIIEAMAVGLPCITTNVSGNPELIEKEFLFDYGNVEAIVSIVERLASDKVLYQETSRQNFIKSLEFKKEILDGRRKEFYNKIRNYIESHRKN